MDLTRGSSHDHVDNPFWSVFQIKLKALTSSGPSDTLTTIGDADTGKVRILVDNILKGAFVCEPHLWVKAAARDKERTRKTTLAYPALRKGRFRRL